MIAVDRWTETMKVTEDVVNVVFKTHLRTWRFLPPSKYSMYSRQKERKNLQPTCTRDILQYLPFLYYEIMIDLYGFN
jgi:hypothetical protein